MFAAWSSPEAVFQMLKQVSEKMPNDITGIRDYRMIDECGGIQWPLTEADASHSEQIPVERRLFEDGRFFTLDRRARFLFENPRRAPELPDEDYPFFLMTGRGTSSQWHTNTRTAKSDVLRKLYPKDCYVEINPRDALRLRIQKHAMVEISSRRARILARAFVTPTVQPGQLFIPMHYSEVNRLTFPAFDFYSRQPSYKACAVKIEPA
jgi:anaerobic selenocysteine-containing dehydrogenase